MRPTLPLDQFKPELLPIFTQGGTIPHLAAHLSQVHGIHVGRSTLWRRCKEWGWVTQMPTRVRLPKDDEAKQQLEEKIAALFRDRRSDAEIVELLERDARENGTAVQIGSRRALRRLRKEWGLRHRKFNGPLPPTSSSSSLNGQLVAGDADTGPGKSRKAMDEYVKEKRRTHHRQRGEHQEGQREQQQQQQQPQQEPQIELPQQASDPSGERASETQTGLFSADKEASGRRKNHASEHTRTARRRIQSHVGDAESPGPSTPILGTSTVQRAAEAQIPIDPQLPSHPQETAQTATSLDPQQQQFVLGSFYAGQEEAFL